MCGCLWERRTSESGKETFPRRSSIFLNLSRAKIKERAAFSAFQDPSASEVMRADAEAVLRPFKAFRCDFSTYHHPRKHEGGERRGRNGCVSGLRVSRVDPVKMFGKRKEPWFMKRKEKIITHTDTYITVQYASRCEMEKLHLGYPQKYLLPSLYWMSALYRGLVISETLGSIFDGILLLPATLTSACSCDIATFSDLLKINLEEEEVVREEMASSQL
ncbi:uncharacterized protein LOC120226049 [Hyaena hyaena]|uniref:uncharacterized protein LOC120226049 n=1 Tax=Hyaena hyaena TaxID=95912 RepID=UPI001924E4C0|nr:uncharacterized protein LOC120226049 [Hyaena hyaena]